MDAGKERKWAGICEEETPKVREKEETGRTMVPADGKGVSDGNKVSPASLKVERREGRAKDGEI